MHSLARDGLAQPSLVRTLRQIAEGQRPLRRLFSKESGAKDDFVVLWPNVLSETRGVDVV